MLEAKFFATGEALMAELMRLPEKVGGTIWGPTPFYSLICPYGLKDSCLTQFAELVTKSSFKLVDPNKVVSVIGASHALGQLVFQSLENVFSQAIGVKVASTAESDHLLTFFETNQAFFLMRFTFGLS